MGDVVKVLRMVIEASRTLDRNTDASKCMGKLYILRVF